ncbi:MAG: hypothetical protein ACD_79C00224G0004 [uncultured bacterium]|nr:MAG: hypothetical protein ACD_79C00224G0004 [uncultured bacterium]
MSVDKKWYDNKRFVIILLFLFFPIGLYAMWKNKEFTKATKWIVTGFIILLILGSGSKEQNVASVSSKKDTSPPSQSSPEKVDVANPDSIKKTISKSERKSKYHDLEKSKPLDITYNGFEELANFAGFNHLIIENDSFDASFKRFKFYETIENEKGKIKGKGLYPFVATVGKNEKIYCIALSAGVEKVPLYGHSSKGEGDEMFFNYLIKNLENNPMWFEKSVETIFGGNAALFYQKYNLLAKCSKNELFNMRKNRKFKDMKNWDYVFEVSDKVVWLFSVWGQGLTMVVQTKEYFEIEKTILVT